ncbi:MAG: F0F1 ATP synthase subunit delta [Planctomycetota bacterium]
MSETPKHDTVLDIGAEQLGATYAKALIAAADSAGAADEVLQQLRDIVQDAIGQNPQLAAALESPRVDREDKIRIIDRLFGDSHPVLLRFLRRRFG